MANDLRRIAENITLLQMLCNKPLPPTKNELRIVDCDESRTFTTRQELEIVECLTYLSVYSDEPGQVMALCIEEQRDHLSLVVSFATNTGSTNFLKQSIQGIVEVLERQAKSPRSDCLNELLASVFAYSRARVVRRLGFRNTPKRLENSTAARLERALSCYAKIQTRVAESYGRLCDLSKELSRLSRHFDETKSTTEVDANSTLISILNTASEIWSSHRIELRDILHCIPKYEMDDNVKEYLEAQLGHLGHYIPTARRLLKHAQRFPLFKSIAIRAVFIAPPALSSSSFQTRPPNALHSEAGETRREDIRNRVAIPQGSNRYKVHAEVQLLVHYEQNPDVRYPPRVLKSSKDACFLCDLFIKAHGKHYIPKTHGRVYAQWMLPIVQHSGVGEDTYAEAVGRFNNDVEDLLLKFQRNKKRTHLNNPRVCGIFSLAPSSARICVASTNSSNERVLSQATNATPSGSPSQEEDIHGASTLTECACLHLPSSSSSLIQTDLGENDNLDYPTGARDADFLTPPTPPTTPTPEAQSTKISVELGSPPSPPSPVHIFNLHRGIPHSHTFALNGPPIRFHTPKIHIELSRHQANDLVSQSFPDLVCKETKSIHMEALWLDISQIATLQPHSDDVNLESMIELDLEKGWCAFRPREGILFSELGLGFRKGSDIVRLRAIGCT